MAQSTDTFTTSGSWTAPEGVTSIQVECWGGGGSGGGARANTSAGGGGAGGCYTITYAYKVVPGTTYTVTIGSGGAHSTGTSFADGSTGGAGGDTWFDSTSGVLAKGGAAGFNIGTTSAGAGNGGTASTAGCIGDLSYKGGHGRKGTGTGTGGGGGGGAGSTGDGGGAADPTVTTGSTAGTGTTVDGGNGGAGGTTAAGSAASSTGFGGGGGGGGATSATDRLGGDGRQGQVKVTYEPNFISQKIIQNAAIQRSYNW